MTDRDELDLLKGRIAELEAENKRLQRELSEARAQAARAAAEANRASRKWYVGSGK